MSLRFPWPTGTTIDSNGDGVRACLPDGLRIEVSPLRARPDSMAAWAREVVSDPVVAEGSDTTDVGWPLHWIEVAGGAMFVFYALLDRAALVILRPATPVARGDLVALARTARPDLASDRIPALVDLWA